MISNLILTTTIHLVSRFDLKPPQDVREPVAGGVHNALHVQCLVLVGLVLLPLVERPLQHEATDVVCSEEPHHLLLHVLPLKLGDHLWLRDGLHGRGLNVCQHRSQGTDGLLSCNVHGCGVTHSGNLDELDNPKHTVFYREYIPTMYQTM